MRSRILIVSGLPLVRRGLRAIVDSATDLESIAEAASGSEALALTLQWNPDVLICDTNLPDMSVFDVTRQLHLQAPNAAIVLLAAEEDPDKLFQAVKSGAVALVTTTVSEETLLATLRAAARGEHLIDQTIDQPAVASRVLSQFTNLSDETPVEMTPLFAPLSPREIEILEQICRGNSNKQIGRALAISDQTVKNHITSILKKLAVNDRTEAVVFSLRQGWIRIDNGPRM